MASYVVKKGDTSPIIYVAADEMISTTGWTCALRVLDYAGTALVSKTITDTNDAGDQFTAWLTPAETAVLSVETYRLVIELSNASETPPYNAEQQHVLIIDPEMEVGDATGLIQLVQGTNSFSTYETLLNELAKMPHLSMAINADRGDLKGALMAAYLNIGVMKTDFGVYDDTVSDYKYSTAEFTSAEIDALDASAQTALIRAQLTEANCLLGGNPIEDRRRMGLLSDSVGESAQFFRTSKPLQMPIYRETAFQLKGYLVWSYVVNR